MSEWVLGLGGSDHDFSAALMRDGDIRVAVEQERLSRRKYGETHWFESPVQLAIDYCLAAERIKLSDVAAIVSSDTLPTRVRTELQGSNLRLFPHHLCHAASAYMMLPPGSKAGVLVYDGFGSIVGPIEDQVRAKRETFSFFLFGPEGYRILGQTLGRATVEGDDFPIMVTDSMGLLYELVTAELGYEPLEAGKTMGLASHGEPRHADMLKRFIQYRDDPDDFFRCALDNPDLPHAIEKLLVQSPNVFGAKADLAASVQAVINETALRALGFFSNRALDHLCIAGGCALNTVTNSYLIENAPFDVPFSIASHSGDAGLGFGAFWLHEFEKRKRPPQLTFRDGEVNPALARPGRTYAAAERAKAVQQFYPRLSLDPSVRTARDLAQIIATGDVIGLVNGGSEIGPRALGGRSIIADPLQISTKERINRLLKKREPFRPLAPMVLEDRYDDYFYDRRCADPYMLRVARVRERCRTEAPAVVHVDGTARVQLVRHRSNPLLAGLLQEFEALTGRAVLLNTSFNRRGEPIVETPLDAIDAFLGMELDGLYLDGDFYRAAISSSR
ncbi:carbamoyltransferase C-terminal domain-containing protein [Bradyrhizobium sp. USDA 4451]